MSCHQLLPEGPQLLDMELKQWVYSTHPSYRDQATIICRAISIPKKINSTLLPLELVDK